MNVNTLERFMSWLEVHLAAVAFAEVGDTEAVREMLEEQLPEDPPGPRVTRLPVPRPSHPGGSPA